MVKHNHRNEMVIYANIILVINNIDIIISFSNLNASHELNKLSGVAVIYHHQN
jgi:hypothetical protein